MNGPVIPSLLYEYLVSPTPPNQTIQPTHCLFEQRLRLGRLEFWVVRRPLRGVHKSRVRTCADCSHMAALYSTSGTGTDDIRPCPATQPSRATRSAPLPPSHPASHRSSRWSCCPDRGQAACRWDHPIDHALPPLPVAVAGVAGPVPCCRSSGRLKVRVRPSLRASPAGSRRTSQSPPATWTARSDAPTASLPCLMPFAR